MLFAHGTNNSKDVLILFNSELQFEIKSLLNDNDGKYIFVEVTIQGSPFLLVNVYAPTNSLEQCSFFEGIISTLDELNVDPDGQIIIGGDFNTHLDSTLDNLGGIIETKSSVRKIEELKTAYDLIDIWRIQNPDKKILLGPRKKRLLDVDWTTS